jgi:hypothetical protein
VTGTEGGTRDSAAPRSSFAEFFAAEIAPALPALEAQRRDRRRGAVTRALGTAFVVVAAALIAGMAVHAFAGGAVLIAGTVAGFIWARRPAGRHREAVRARIVPALCRYLGTEEYHRKPGKRFDMARVQKSGIAGAFTRASLQDLFVGRHRATGFRMVEARLFRKRRTGGGNGGRERRSVFAGLLCDIEVPVKFGGAVLLVGERDTRGEWIAGIMRRNFPAAAPVAFDHPAFDARFRVLSDNPAEARRLLPPPLLETLLALAEEIDAAEKRAGFDGGLNAAFLDGRFLMAIPQRRNLFEIGQIDRSLDHAEEDLRRLALEFTIPERLIDSLHGDRKPLLPQG